MSSLAEAIGVCPWCGGSVADMNGMLICLENCEWRAAEAEQPDHVTLDSGEREVFETGMVRDSRKGKGRFDLISPFALRRLALLYERGAVGYNERNWELGAPYCRFIDSALRHLTQYMAGQTDEDHLTAAAWNLLAVIHFEETGRDELDDRPDYGQCPRK